MAYKGFGTSSTSVAEAAGAMSKLSNAAIIQGHGQYGGGGPNN